MKKLLILLMILMPAVCMAQSEKFTQDNFKVETDVVEVVNNKMSLDIQVVIQPNFFGRNTLATITPVFCWGTKQLSGKSLRLQGEMVDDNCRIVGYKHGVTDKISIQMDYQRGMEKGKFFADVVLSSSKGKTKPVQRIELPVRIDQTMLLAYETVKDAQFNRFTAQNGNGGLADYLFYRAQNTKNVSERLGSLDQALVYRPGDYKILNNIALCYLERGDADMAEQYFQKALDANPSSADVNANMCLLSLQKGDVDAASDFLLKSEGAANYNEAFGTMLLLRGQISYAAVKLNDVNTNSGILAQVLNDKFAQANKLIDTNTHKNGMTYYLQALLGVRSRNSDLVAAALDNLKYVDPRMYAKTKDDPEFTQYKDLFKRP